jgi:murein L,D-transpeptidase YcbB/YkuD
MEKFFRALALAAAVAAAAAPARAASEGAAALDAVLAAARPEDGCQASAIAATRARLSATALPLAGRFVLVNIPSGTLTAYQDGEPALQMAAVVGSPSSPTPERGSEIEYVRFNPTWTVPASILREPAWRRRASDPAFLAENGFHAYRPDGREAAPGDAVARLVQDPGERNVLGQVKFGLRGMGDIYLHDTNDPAAFDESVRALSHGCVRLERPVTLAAWLLGVPVDRAEEMLEAGDRADRRLPDRVPVFFSYFTAWPDADGRVLYYPDVYGKDSAPACRGR